MKKTISCFLGLSLALASVAPFSCFAQKETLHLFIVDENSTKVDALQSQINDMKKNLDENISKSNQKDAALLKLQKQLNAVKAELEKSVKSSSEKNVNIQNLQKTVVNLDKMLTQLSETAKNNGTSLQKKLDTLEKELNKVKGKNSLCGKGISWLKSTFFKGTYYAICAIIAVLAASHFDWCKLPSFSDALSLNVDIKTVACGAVGTLFGFLTPYFAEIAATLAVEVGVVALLFAIINAVL